MAAVRVRITTQLEAQLTGENADPTVILQDFTDWKSTLLDEHYEFGKDALGIGCKYLYHVHMAPLNVQPAKDKWKKAWENYHRRTSDRYLFYANGGLSEGYLLIALINDPGGHAVWAPGRKAERDQLEAVAEDFCVFGKLP